MASVHAYGKQPPPPEVARLRSLFDGLVLVRNARQEVIVRSTWLYKEALEIKWTGKAMLQGTILGQASGKVEVKDLKARLAAASPTPPGQVEDTTHLGGVKGTAGSNRAH